MLLIKPKPTAATVAYLPSPFFLWYPSAADKEKTAAARETYTRTQETHMYPPISSADESGF